ncbi:MAG: hypothetical protein I3273_05740 [Candidatus Moeniiplasma glomeromycotorum]|nr:hypothetical protein [Candidatus Moeniiplasma glomeromycotorum]MCE8169587.1 hypothetical protein [Candidatus Moeniiplasma glomeromycotorum]
MSTNKKTTKTINRRTRHVLKKDSKLSETEQPKSSLDSFWINRRSKKGGVKYEEKPISREAKVNQKVKNWREKQVKKIEQPHTCKKCGGWTEGDSCHCNCISKVPNHQLIQEINRRLMSKKMKFEVKPLPKKKIGSKMK